MSHPSPHPAELRQRAVRWTGSPRTRPEDSRHRPHRAVAARTHPDNTTTPSRCSTASIERPADAAVTAPQANTPDMINQDVLQ